MPSSSTRLVEKCAQWRPKDDAKLVPGGTRGIYALLHFRRRLLKYDVVYIGMAAKGGIRSRLKRHMKSQTKVWSHFSIFKVCEHISGEEVEELEGLFREIYRKDKRANRFNKQKKCKKIQMVRENDLGKWSRVQ
jgi:hypothetical protein